MYAYAKVIIERPGVRALPLAALTHQRRQDLLLDVRERPCGADRDPDGRQRRRVDRGHQSSSGRRRPAADDPWTPINGSEQVILGDLSILADGAPVEVVPGVGRDKNLE